MDKILVTIDTELAVAGGPYFLGNGENKLLYCCLILLLLFLCVCAYVCIRIHNYLRIALVLFINETKQNKIEINQFINLNETKLNMTK